MTWVVDPGGDYAAQLLDSLCSSRMAPLWHWFSELRMDDAQPRETILVVDDDVGLRSVTQLALEQDGYRVLAAADGDEALELARTYPGPIHLLVTDLVMPGMDGAELGRQIGSFRLGIQILYVTAYAVAQLADHQILKGVVLDPEVPILVKPFNFAVLSKKVRRLLDLSPGI